MNGIRQSLEYEVDEVAQDVQAVRDWGSYFKSYAWVCLGVAFVAGYSLVPRRRKALKAPVAGFVSDSEFNTAKTQPAAVEPCPTFQTITSVIVNVAMRLAWNYAEQKINASLARNATERKELQAISSREKSAS
jgi:hypothetical protein